MLKTIILPRQARDKHSTRENSKQLGTFSRSDGAQCLASNTHCGHHWQVKSQPPLSSDDEASIGLWYTNVLMSLLSVDDIVKDIYSILTPAGRQAELSFSDRMIAATLTPALLFCSSALLLSCRLVVSDCAHSVCWLSRRRRMG
jgi:hypothetical protein